MFSKPSLTTKLYLAKTVIDIRLQDKNPTFSQQNKALSVLGLPRKLNRKRKRNAFYTEPNSRLKDESSKYLREKLRCGRDERQSAKRLSRGIGGSTKNPRVSGLIYILLKAKISGCTRGR